MKKKIIKTIFIVSVATLVAIILFALILTVLEINDRSSNGVGLIGGADSPTFSFLFFSLFKSNPILWMLGGFSLLGSFSGVLLLFHKK